MSATTTMEAVPKPVPTHLAHSNVAVDPDSGWTMMEQHAVVSACAAIFCSCDAKYHNLVKDHPRAVHFIRSPNRGWALFRVYPQSSSLRFALMHRQLPWSVCIHNSPQRSRFLTLGQIFFSNKINVVCRASSMPGNDESTGFYCPHWQFGQP